MTAEITLPQPLAAYFAAKNAHDVDGMLALFAPDAVAHDTGENTTLRGTGELAPWIARTTGVYKVTLELTGVAERDGKTVVSTLVSGDFPGSPFPFAYHFTVQNGLIAELTIIPNPE